MRASQKLSVLLMLLFICENTKKYIIFLHYLHPFRCTCSSSRQAYECHLRRKSLAGHTTIHALLFALLHQKKIYDLIMHLRVEQKGDSRKEQDLGCMQDAAALQNPVCLRFLMVALATCGHALSCCSKIFFDNGAYCRL